MFRRGPVFWKNLSPGLLFDPVDGNDTYLQNMMLSSSYMALQLILEWNNSSLTPSVRGKTYIPSLPTELDRSLTRANCLAHLL
jgi:hypothetical protein